MRWLKDRSPMNMDNGPSNSGTNLEGILQVICSFSLILQLGKPRLLKMKWFSESQNCLIIKPEIEARLGYSKSRSFEASCHSHPCLLCSELSKPVSSNFYLETWLLDYRVFWISSSSYYGLETALHNEDKYLILRNW